MLPYKYKRPVIPTTMNPLPSLRFHGCRYTYPEESSNVPLYPSLILISLGFHYSGVRTSSLTVNYSVRRYIISNIRMHVELLVIHNIHYLILPTWIRFPNHSYLLKSPASIISSTTSPDLTPFAYQRVIGSRRIRHLHIRLFCKNRNYTD